MTRGKRAFGDLRFPGYMVQRLLYGGFALVQGAVGATVLWRVSRMQIEIQYLGLGC